jgi:DNA polymerase delta subunit 1
LNNVSKEYLGDQKNDLPAMQIFERFEGNADDRAVIASYAAKDTTLPLQLLKKMAIFEDLTEMANAVKVPVDNINFRGQQIRCFSCLFGKSREMGYSIPDDKAWTAEGKYEGATVLEPKKGAYFTPIAALDFASCEYSGGTYSFMLNKSRR